MKRYYYCNYTAFVILLNEGQANFHLDVAVIFKTDNNKSWTGEYFVGRQVIQYVKPGGPV